VAPLAPPVRRRRFSGGVRVILASHPDCVPVVVYVLGVRFHGLSVHGQPTDGDARNFARSREETHEDTFLKHSQLASDTRAYCVRE